MPLKTKKSEAEAAKKQATANGTYKKTTADVLTELISTFQKIASNPEKSKKASTQPLMTAKLPEPLKSAVVKIQELAGISQEDQPYWLKCVFRRDKSFSGIKNPEIALVSGEPSIIIDNIVYEATELLNSDFFQVIEKEATNQANEKVYTYYGVVSIKNSGLGSENLPIIFWTEASTKLEASMMCDREYLISSLYEYIFPLSQLPSGVYPVKDYGKHGKFFTCTIQDTDSKTDSLYYLTEEQVTKQLDVLRREKKPLNVIVTEPISVTKNGVTGTYKSTYIEGFARATSIKSYIAGLNIQPDDEVLKEKGLFMFEEPVVLDLKDITETQYTNKEGQVVKQKAVTVLHEDNTVTLIANSPIKKAIENGKFSLSEGETYEGYKIIIRGVKLGNKGYEYQTSFEVPQVNVEESMSDLFADLGFTA